MQTGSQYLTPTLTVSLVINSEPCDHIALMHMCNNNVDVNITCTRLIINLYIWETGTVLYKYYRYQGTMHVSWSRDYG